MKFGSEKCNAIIWIRDQGLRSREFSEVSELHNLKFSYDYIRRFVSDQNLRKTNEHRLVISSRTIYLLEWNFISVENLSFFVVPNQNTQNLNF